MTTEHLMGLLLGTEEDWPGAFEAVVARLKPEIRYGGELHTFGLERITIEPFDLRAVPRYSLVIDRLAHWYYVPREWLKKIALMDDVYLLNNPFTFQSMEKHSAYCAMMRLGLKIPTTWMLPTKKPPENERFPYTAAKYNQSFSLEEVAEQVGYPMYMKPFDGGAWVGVTRVAGDAELHRRYDESGERLMHLQSSLENFEVFARSLSIGAETMVMHYEPDRPLHDRYQVDHGFLTPSQGEEVLIISRLVNAFFRWEFNSCETIVKSGEVHPIDYANACPDMSLISLHYYFPWAIKTLVKWSIFCTVTGRKMRVDQDIGRFFEIGDDDSLTYEQKLARYREMTDEYFQLGSYHEFCNEHLSEIDEVMVDYIESDDFDRLLVETVTSTFPANEHEKFVTHYRGLLAAWAHDQA
ncbi:MAG: RimK family alpha-L-glutamate ligase [Actinomycetota bacterium]